MRRTTWIGMASATLAVALPRTLPVPARSRKWPGWEVVPQVQ